MKNLKDLIFEALTRAERKKLYDVLYSNIENIDDDTLQQLTSTYSSVTNNEEDINNIRNSLNNNEYKVFINFLKKNGIKSLYKSMIKIPFNNIFIDNTIITKENIIDDIYNELIKLNNKEIFDREELVELFNTCVTNKNNNACGHGELLLKTVITDVYNNGDADINIGDKGNILKIECKYNNGRLTRQERFSPKDCIAAFINNFIYEYNNENINSELINKIINNKGGIYSGIKNFINAYKQLYKEIYGANNSEYLKYNEIFINSLCSGLLAGYNSSSFSKDLIKNMFNSDGIFIKKCKLSEKEYSIEELNKIYKSMGTAALLIYMYNKFNKLIIFNEKMNYCIITNEPNDILKSYNDILNFEKLKFTAGPSISAGAGTRGSMFKIKLL